MRLALVNTKGGVGKTTAAVYLATGLSARGRTLLVDCDPQQSALLWSVDVETPFTVVSLPVADVHKRVPGLAAGYEHVVFDTPPGNIPIIKSAVKAVEVVLVPVQPSPVEINRLSPTFELLADLEDVHPVRAGVLLNMMRYSTNSARGIRSLLEDELNYPVLSTEIPLSEAYRTEWGRAPANLGQYDLLIKELLS